MKFNCEAVAGLVILDQAHQCAHRGILERGAKLLGSVAQCAVVTGGIRASKQQLGAGAALLGAFLQRISQCVIQQVVRCLNCSRTSALGNGLRRKMSLHDGIECSVAWSGEVFGATLDLYPS